MEIQQKENETLAAYVHHFKMEAKRCDFNNDTATMCTFIKGLWDAHRVAAKLYEKDHQTLSEAIKLAVKLNIVQQITATFSSPTVNMMSNNDSCFVCDKKGYIGHHYPEVQCYKCNGFSHFAQDCPEKIPPSGTHCHYNRSCSHSHHNHSHRDRSHSFHYICMSGSHHQPQLDRSSSNYWIHASYSLSCHHSSLQYPSTDRHSRRHSHRDTPHHHRMQHVLNQTLFMLEPLSSLFHQLQVV